MIQKIAIIVATLAGVFAIAGEPENSRISCKSKGNDFKIEGTLNDFSEDFDLNISIQDFYQGRFFSKVHRDGSETSDENASLWVFNSTADKVFALNISSKENGDLKSPLIGLKLHALPNSINRTSQGGAVEVQFEARAKIVIESRVGLRDQSRDFRALCKVIDFGL